MSQEGDKLLPCPFCGGEARLWSSGLVSCSNELCASSGEAEFYATREVWNTRATPVVNREDVRDDMREAFLVRWDNARAKLLDGDTSDMPRMIIESALDDYHDAATASAEGKYAGVIYWLDQALNHGPLNSEDYRTASKALAEAAPLLRGKV